MFEAAGMASNVEPGMVLTLLKISFKNIQFTTSTRSGLYSSTDSIADCGGLLGKMILIQISAGLSMGFSILSLIEIFYFITLRLVCKFK